MVVTDAAAGATRIGRCELIVWWQLRAERLSSFSKKDFGDKVPAHPPY